MKRALSSIEKDTGPGRETHHLWDVVALFFGLNFGRLGHMSDNVLISKGFPKSMKRVDSYGEFRILG